MTTKKHPKVKWYCSEHFALREPVTVLQVKGEQARIRATLPNGKRLLKWVSLSELKIV